MLSSCRENRLIWCELTWRWKCHKVSLHAHLFIFIYPFTLVHIQGVPARKKRRLAAPLPPLPPQQDRN